MKAIKIKNWSKYQSYKDRRPPWIRFHRSILDDYQFQTMSAEARALLPMLWLLACENKDPKAGLIELQIKEIAFRLRQSIENIEYCLRELQTSDFIECIESVTKPLQECNEIVPPETETETETDTDLLGIKPPKTVNCPHSEIVNLWHEVLPQCKQVRVWGDDRQKALAARWKELLKRGRITDKQSGLDYFRELFEFISSSNNFLVTSNWFGLDWLILPKNFAKVIEGSYIDDDKK